MNRQKFGFGSSGERLNEKSDGSKASRTRSLSENICLFATRSRSLVKNGGLWASRNRSLGRNSGLEASGSRSLGKNIYRFASVQDLLD